MLLYKCGRDIGITFAGTLVILTVLIAIGSLSRGAGGSAGTGNPGRNGDGVDRASAVSGEVVHSIELPVLKTDFPPGPGRDAAAAVCIVCHSTRYITTQPRFPRQTWSGVVDKMRKTYGAPMTDAQAAETVDYLVAVRGPEVPATKP